MGQPFCGVAYEFSVGARSIIDGRVLVDLKTRRADKKARVSGQIASRLRQAEARPLGEECGPSAAAVGTTGPVRVVIVARVLAIVDFGELAQRFQQVSDLQRAGRVGRLLEYQEQPRAA